ncbi:spindle and centriole-associated protein 1-like isoform X1 [Argonauta hians]
MSFIRKGRSFYSTKILNKKRKKRPEWDATTTDLSVYKSNPEELMYRKKIHQSKHLPSVRFQANQKKNNKDEISLNLAKLSSRQLAVMREVLYDQDQLKTILDYSDRALDQVSDLCGDNPKRYQAFPAITAAPNVKSDAVDKAYLPKEVPEHRSRLDNLSSSLMDLSALNDDCQKKGTAYSASSECLPSSQYTSHSEMERFRKLLKAEEKNLLEAQHSLLEQSPPLTADSPEQVTGGGEAMCTPDQNYLRTNEAVNDTIKVNKVRRVLNPEVVPPSSDAEQPQSDRGFTLKDLKKVLEEMQREMIIYEENTGKVPAEKQQQETFSGYTMSLCHTVIKLCRYLRETDEQLQEQRRLCEDSKTETSQLKFLIDALTLNLIESQDKYNSLYADMKEFQRNTTEEIVTLKIRLGRVANEGVTESLPQPLLQQRAPSQTIQGVTGPLSQPLPQQRAPSQVNQGVTDPISQPLLQQRASSQANQGITGPTSQPLLQQRVPSQPNQLIPSHTHPSLSSTNIHHQLPPHIHYQLPVTSHINQPLPSQVSQPILSQASQPLLSQASQPLLSQASQPLLSQVHQQLPSKTYNQTSQSLPSQVSQTPPSQTSQPLPSQIHHQLPLPTHQPFPPQDFPQLSSQSHTKLATRTPPLPQQLSAIQAHLEEQQQQRHDSVQPQQQQRQPSVQAQQQESQPSVQAQQQERQPSVQGQQQQRQPSVQAQKQERQASVQTQQESQHLDMAYLASQYKSLLDSTRKRLLGSVVEESNANSWLDSSVYAKPQGPALNNFSAAFQLSPPVQRTRLVCSDSKEFPQEFSNDFPGSNAIHYNDQVLPKSTQQQQQQQHTTKTTSDLLGQLNKAVTENVVFSEETSEIYDLDIGNGDSLDVKDIDGVTAATPTGISGQQNTVSAPVVLPKPSDLAVTDRDTAPVLGENPLISDTATESKSFLANQIEELNKQHEEAEKLLQKFLQSGRDHEGDMLKFGGELELGIERETPTIFQTVSDRQYTETFEHQRSNSPNLFSGVSPSISPIIVEDIDDEVV